MTLEQKLKHAIKSNNIDRIHNVFDEIYVTYGRLVYFKIMQYIDNKLDVEELTQDVFVSFYNNIIPVEIVDIKYYLMTSAKNKAIDFLKKKNKDIVLDEKAILEKRNTVNYTIEYNEIIEKMKAVLNDLEIDIILKHNMDELSFKELANEYQKPLNTILSIYHRGLKKLRREEK